MLIAAVDLGSVEQLLPVLTHSPGIEEAMKTFCSCDYVTRLPAFLHRKYGANLMQILGGSTMVRTERKTSRGCMPDVIRRAIDHYHTTEDGVKKTAALFDVPKTTLRRQLLKFKNLSAPQREKNVAGLPLGYTRHRQVFTDEQELALVKWIRQGQTNLEELRAFIGIFLNMGLIQKANLQAYWDSSHESQSTPWFIKHFSRDRFQLLLKFLHFADNNMPDQNHPNYKLYKIQPVIDHFREKFLHYYQPHWDISIDESMIGYKGKTPHLRMFMPNKRHTRFGIKLWCLSDSTNGYLCRFEVCKGAHNPRDPENVHGTTYALVMWLMRDSGFLNKGYHLCLDNYFSSPLLFQTLHVQQTTATGTVRTHRRGLPRDCITRRLRNGEVSERRKGPLLCVAYKDGNRKPVLLSTAATAGYSKHQNRRGNRVQKPNTVLLYNRAMGGVDLGDAQLYMYLAERRTMKWTTKVAFSLFGRAILNSYLLYKMNTSYAPVLSRYLFMVSVVESLAGNYYPPQNYIRMACDCLGPRGDDKNGCRDAWIAHRLIAQKASTITSYRENRFNNCLFVCLFVA
ncbi:piggyBac transposable element-derived protein 4-like [Littorina saxatilis]|uniref:piggyBac transposable element-derived protein 4-like n=1 Tax=Littorina saxatilis TaxID=31220 RepID=UPI0038B55F99